MGNVFGRVGGKVAFCFLRPCVNIDYNAADDCGTFHGKDYSLKGAIAFNRNGTVVTAAHRVLSRCHDAFPRSYVAYMLKGKAWFAADFLNIKSRMK